jgi:DnaD/phage-associated family protein
MPAHTVAGYLRRTVSGVIHDHDATVAIPATFFTDVLPDISSIEELHVMLCAFRALDERGRLTYPIAERAFIRDRGLRTALRVKGSPREPDRRILQGLELAIARGTLIRFNATAGRRRTVWYYVNTPQNRAAVLAMERGQIAPPEDVWPDDQPPTIRVERPNAFRLYEQNIGPLTPLIADHISQAIEDYPEDWIEDAIGEAVAYNRRNWRYVTRILESWQNDGREERNP